VGSDAVVDSSLVSLSCFGAANGQVLVTRTIPGLLSLATVNCPVVFRHILGKDIFCKPSNLMLVVTGSATSGSASSMAAFGPIQTSSGLVLESFGPKSSVQASPF
jgi:hypothetical protein